MERSASVGNQFYSASVSSSSSLRHVKNSCGSCGYELNLRSTIGSKQGKSIKSGIISFFNIDEGRFSKLDEFLCMLHLSRHSVAIVIAILAMHLKRRLPPIRTCNTKCYF